MTTFNTRNQAKRKYFYIAGVLVLLLVIVTLAFNSLRNSNKCDPNSEVKNSPLNSTIAQVKNDIKQYVTISTDFGQIKGLVNKLNNTIINTFLGVPYASPPIGSLRFEKTSPLKPWEGVRDAIQQPASCLQTDSPLVLFAFRFLNSSLSEDCLYLNIWSPAQDDQFLPVIVYIHGGAFAYGGVATDELDGTVLAAEQEVVVVTIQYRLGIFGFLSFESQAPNGNMGLYDQREALKWIHSNINKFGGDQDRITVVGHGAGAVSAGLHMITSESKSYFQRSILQGLSLMWSKNLYSQSIKHSKELAEKINCFNAPKIKECIKVVNVDKLLEIQMEILEDNPVAFGPVIPNEFLSTFPSESIEMFDFQTEFMLGVNSEDDSLFLTTLRGSQEEEDEHTDHSKTDDDSKDDDSKDDDSKDDDSKDDDSKSDDSKDNGSKDDDDSGVESTTNVTPVERKTSKPILIVTTPQSTTVESNYTSDPLNIQNNNRTSNITEAIENIERDDEEEESSTKASEDEDSEEGDDEEDGRRRRKRLTTDEYGVQIVCPLLQFSDAIVETNRSVYIYQLSEFSSYHDEIVFAFGYPLKYRNLYYKEDIKLSNYLMNNWAQFARNGDLSETDEQWKSYTKENPSYLKISMSNVTLAKFNSQDCNQMNTQ